MIIIAALIAISVLFIAIPIHKSHLEDFYEFNRKAEPVLYCDKILAPMTFEEFYSFYQVNPDKWKLAYKHAVYVKRNPNVSATKYAVTWKTVSDYQKYKRFIVQLEEDKARQELELKESIKRHNLEQVLQDVQKDIDNLRAEAQKDIKYAREITERVGRR